VLQAVLHEAPLRVCEILRAVVLEIFRYLEATGIASDETFEAGGGVVLGHGVGPFKGWAARPCGTRLPASIRPPPRNGLRWRRAVRR